ncbi:DUF3336 domain-containing protein [Algicola sagamiensis]|uniref:DUF3336 domain-containing protein n=1 Tax=Algicola sagamiensis TaxID=163869 RepID=UPI00036F3240|nr:DUF3336 domain-containing protein [Algicola sagamiensis]
MLRKLQQAIDHAKTYSEYREACLAYDHATRNQEWKEDDISKEYDYKLIRRRLSRLRTARANQDASTLMYILHEGIHGNLGNISNPHLYRHTKIGTKKLIETFLDEVCDALKFIYETKDETISFHDKLRFFESTEHAFGSSCFMLSGGAGLGFFHAGVVKCLLEQNLMPNVISGASAGAIITAMLGTRTDDEVKMTLSPAYIYEHFQDWGKLAGPFSDSLLDPYNLENALIQLFDLETFEEAYKRTGRAINITVSPADIHQHSRLLNASTSPNAVITQAVRASCAIPYLFSPVQLKAKTRDGNIVPYVPNRKFADGSIMDDMPIDRLARLYGVNHSIVSQTNPLAVPFLSRSREKPRGVVSLTMRHVANLAKVNSIYACDMLESVIWNEKAQLGLHKIRSIIDQQYVGDINILPPRSLMNLKYILKNPTKKGIAELVFMAEKATWPQIETIKNATRISTTLQYYTQLLHQEESKRLISKPKATLTVVSAS